MKYLQGTRQKQSLHKPQQNSGIKRGRSPLHSGIKPQESEVFTMTSTYSNGRARFSIDWTLEGVAAEAEAVSIIARLQWIFGDVAEIHPDRDECSVIDGNGDIITVIPCTMRDYTKGDGKQ